MRRRRLRSELEGEVLQTSPEKTAASKDLANTAAPSETLEPTQDALVKQDTEVLALEEDALDSPGRVALTAVDGDGLNREGMQAIPNAGGSTNRRYLNIQTAQLTEDFNADEDVAEAEESGNEKAAASGGTENSRQVTPLVVAFQPATTAAHWTHGKGAHSVIRTHMAGLDPVLARSDAAWPSVHSTLEHRENLPAILQALLRVWPTDRLSVADRGLRDPGGALFFPHF